MNPEWHLHDSTCSKVFFVGQACDCKAGTFHEGMAVRKIKGYPMPGIIDSIFRTQAGLVRIVVESTSEDTLGLCHIFNAEQLEPA